ncbi:hypothetical protein SAMN05421747_102258 [Parapedobacter composti]|uniref:Short-chain dehydrogenase n=1 Tax=Parapedobacter composti TaxID=623281 RepID=A0A1I1F5A9_9SPHI|nr:SDR family oxidoreductase [Parapedobacter composti]SFB94575.1 hypothetical protein SAMN05421747_102258 [Parapedobacter composti]
MQQLNNQTALITGATKGMGRTTAEKLAQAGYNVILAARDARALASLKHLLQANHPEISILYYACDFSDDAQRTSFIQWATQEHPHIDVLINNVGIFRPVSVLDETTEDFNLQLQVNYFTPHLLSRAIGQNMRKNRKGHIINISSIASREPVSSAGTYTVTKFAVRGLTHVLRDELRPYGVKVTEIIPGSTLTSSWEGTTIPTEQFVQPSDIAEAVLTCLRMSAGANVDEMIVKPKYGNI